MRLSRCKRRVNSPGIAQLEHGITVNLIRNKQGRIFACESLLNAAAVLLDTDKVVLHMRAKVE